MSGVQQIDHNFPWSTLLDYRNDVIKCSKLKWNHEPRACGFTAKLRVYYHGKLWSICFFYNIYFFKKNQKQNNRHCVTCYVISMVYTLIDHSFRPISARKDSISLCTDVPPPSETGIQSVIVKSVIVRLLTVNPLLSPLGGLFISSPFEERLNRDDRLIEFRNNDGISSS